MNGGETGRVGGLEAGRVAFRRAAVHHALAGTPAHGLGIVVSSRAGGSGCMITFPPERGYDAPGGHGVLGPMKSESHKTCDVKTGLVSGSSAGWPQLALVVCSAGGELVTAPEVLTLPR